jgi:hypothetical protein
VWLRAVQVSSATRTKIRYLLSNLAVSGTPRKRHSRQYAHPIRDSPGAEDNPIFGLALENNRMCGDHGIQDT